MSMAVSSDSEVKAEPNVTPMIDVMLVLLIIFMLVVPAINAGFNAVPPQGQNLKPHPEEDADQVLGIDASGAYYLNKKPIKNEDLPTLLKAIYEARTEDKILFLKAHNQLKYEKVIDALDIAAKNGVRVTGMITDQIPGSRSLIETDNLSPMKAQGGKP
ncbi:MAG: biopolymer transporter ExbD [Gemmatimonadetes bacterium]|jgi:biopolymer transport protein ExbD|nr:biopolymer transporter ExbD [Gemmatimonadota bacterium]